MVDLTGPLQGSLGALHGRATALRHAGATHSVQCRFTVAPLNKLWLKALHVLGLWRGRQRVSARDASRLIGMLQYMSILVHRGRLKLAHPMVVQGPLVPNHRKLGCDTSGSARSDPLAQLGGPPLRFCGACLWAFP